MEDVSSDLRDIVRGCLLGLCWNAALLTFVIVFVTFVWLCGISPELAVAGPIILCCLANFATAGAGANLLQDPDEYADSRGKKGGPDVPVTRSIKPPVPSSRALQQPNAGIQGITLACPSRFGCDRDLTRQQEDPDLENFIQEDAQGSDVEVEPLRDIEEGAKEELDDASAQQNPEVPVREAEAGIFADEAAAMARDTESEAVSVASSSTVPIEPVAAKQNDKDQGDDLDEASAGRQEEDFHEALSRPLLKEGDILEKDSHGAHCQDEEADAVSCEAEMDKELSQPLSSGQHSQTLPDDEPMPDLYIKADLQEDSEVIDGEFSRLSQPPTSAKLEWSQEATASHSIPGLQVSSAPVVEDSAVETGRTAAPSSDAIPDDESFVSCTPRADAADQGDEAAQYFDADHHDEASHGDTAASKNPAGNEDCENVPLLQDGPAPLSPALTKSPTSPKPLQPLPSLTAAIFKQAEAGAANSAGPNSPRKRTSSAQSSASKNQPVAAKSDSRESKASSSSTQSPPKSPRLQPLPNRPVVPESVLLGHNVSSGSSAVPQVAETSSQEPSVFVWTYRHIVHIGPEAAKLGIEIPQPGASSSSEGRQKLTVSRCQLTGTAGRLGIRPGDALVMLNGEATAHQDHSTIVQQLKNRPLTLEMHRYMVTSKSSGGPAIEFITTLQSQHEDSHGISLDLTASPYPTVLTIREKSPAWTSGVAVGDTVVSVKQANGEQCSPETLPELFLMQGPIVLTILRLPCE